MLSPVPAKLPLTPLSAKTPSNPAVSSIDLPVALAIGAASLSDSVSKLKSKEDELVLLANTSTTLCVSLACKPKELTTEPASVAASAKPTSKDAAKSRVASVAANISGVVLPSLAYSVCSCATSTAVN